MSQEPSFVAWLRRRFGWSTSRQSWEERLGVLGLVLGVGGLAWFGDRMTLGQVLLGGALLLIAAAYLLRRGWLQLFGPVLFYDMVRAARRSRYFLLRGLYAGLLLLIVFSIWLEFSLSGRATSRQAATDMAMQFFQIPRRTFE